VNDGSRDSIKAMSMLKLGGDKAKSVPRRWVCALLVIALEDIGLGISFWRVSSYDHT